MLCLCISSGSKNCSFFEVRSITRQLEKLLSLKFRTQKNLRVRVFPQFRRNNETKNKAMRKKQNNRPNSTSPDSGSPNSAKWMHVMEFRAITRGKYERGVTFDRSDRIDARSSEGGPTISRVYSRRLIKTSRITRNIQYLVNSGSRADVRFRACNTDELRRRREDK